MWGTHTAISLTALMPVGSRQQDSVGPVPAGLYAAGAPAPAFSSALGCPLLGIGATPGMPCGDQCIPHTPMHTGETIYTLIHQIPKSVLFFHAPVMPRGASCLSFIPLPCQLSSASYELSLIQHLAEAQLIKELLLCRCCNMYCRHCCTANFKPTGQLI